MKRYFFILFGRRRNQAASLCLRLLKQEQFSPEEQKFKQLEPVLLKPAVGATVGATKQSSNSSFEQ